ncbi:MAG: 23S rRNA methyltransferase, partial [Thiotrichales bacterium]|nr:23S rRNA methyltransferase [Thiotrichales bacterium]
PNMTGNKGVDIPKSMYLVELCVELAEQVLKPGGDLLMKVFQGEGYDQLLTTLKGSYQKVLTRKPKASRARSKEIYLLARGKKH